MSQDMTPLVNLALTDYNRIIRNLRTGATSVFGIFAGTTLFTFLLGSEGLLIGGLVSTIAVRYGPQIANVLRIMANWCLEHPELLFWMSTIVNAVRSHLEQRQLEHQQ